FFFFFQAEDGIRDLTVTGVQTCALPISTEHFFVVRAAPIWPASKGWKTGYEDREGSAVKWKSRRNPDGRIGDERVRTKFAWLPRSEERRVGKECRSRWAAED